MSRRERARGPSIDQDTGEVQPAVAVARAVAEREGVDPAALPPLSGAVDADALNMLAGGGARVDFSYHGYHVTVADGRVAVTCQE